MTLPGLPVQRERMWARELLEVPWQDDTSGTLLGPSAATLRDQGRPRGWAGLSRRDRELLRVWLGRRGSALAELHTGVPVGRVPKLQVEHDTEANRKLVQGVYPRRVDAAVLEGGLWSIVECKPAANHYAVGQVLCYAYWWRVSLVNRPLARSIIVTDEADPDIRPVAAASEIELVELGRSAVSW